MNLFYQVDAEPLQRVSLQGTKLSGTGTKSYLPEYEILVGGQLICGIPVAENHSAGHSKWASS